MNDRRLTIGVPVYRNATTLNRSVTSLLSQTYGDFNLVLSVDNSPDESLCICHEIARSDSRVKVVNQPQNLKYQNFGYLLRQASTDYFMWAAADDWWKPDYVKTCVDLLEGNTEAVLAVTKVMFTVGGVDEELSSGTYALTQSHSQNVARFLTNPFDNSRMYGVFRASAGKASFPAESFHAFDWAFSAALLRFGWHLEADEILLYRDHTDWSSYQRLVISDARTGLDKWVPLLEMSKWLLHESRIPATREVRAALLALNVDRHFSFASECMPRYWSLTQPLERVWRQYLRWRLTPTRDCSQ